MGQGVVDTIYYDSNWKGVPEPIFADYYYIRYVSEDDNYPNKFRGYWMSGELQSEGEFISIDKYNHENSVFNSTCKDYYKNGKIREIIPYRTGKIHGKAFQYYEEGNLSQSTEFEDGKREGEETLYYPNGKIQSIAFFKNDSFHGIVKTYNEDGKIERQGEFKNGLLDGDEIFYYDNGVTQSIIPYVNGIKSGIAAYFNEEGIKTIEREYKNGLLDGILRHYENGNYIQTTFIDQEADVNNLSYYNSNGEFIIGYQNGKRVGLSIPTVDNRKEAGVGQWYEMNGVTLSVLPCINAKTEVLRKTFRFIVYIKNCELWPIECSLSDVSIQHINKYGEVEAVEPINPKIIAEKTTKKITKEIQEAYKNAYLIANNAATVTSYGNSSNITSNRVVSSGNTKSSTVAAAVNNSGYAAVAAGKSNSSTNSTVNQSVSSFGFSSNKSVDGATRYQVLEIEKEKASQYAEEREALLDEYIDGLYYSFTVQPNEEACKGIHAPHKRTKIVKLTITVNEIPYIFEWDYNNLPEEE